MPVQHAAQVFGASVAADGAVTSTEITDSTHPGRALLTAPTKEAQKSLLSIVADDINDATQAGRNLLRAPSPAAQRDALFLGTAALVNTGTAPGTVPVFDTNGYLPGDQIRPGSLGNNTLAPMPIGFKGAGADGPVTNLTPAQATELLNLATAATKGLMSPLDKAKLDTYANVDRFKGYYASMAALTAAHGLANPGDWAIIGHGPGVGATVANWDSDNTPPAWTDASTGGGITPASIGSGELANGGVTTPKIADGAVTPAKLAVGAAEANLGYLPANAASTNAQVSTLTNAVNGKAAIDGSNMTGRLGVEPLEVTDWNTATSNGFYRGAAGATNAPDGNYWHGYVTNYNIWQGVQTIFNPTADEMRRLYTFTASGPSFGPWRSVTTGVVDVRLGAEVDGVPAGHVATAIYYDIVDIGNDNFVRDYKLRSRPLQKLINGTWTTVSQL